MRTQQIRPTNSTQINLIMDPNQVQSVAEFLHFNNDRCQKTVDEWEKSIYDTIKRYAFNPNISFCGTGGYMVKFSEIDVDTVEVEILVDITVGEGGHYIEVTLDRITNSIFKKFA